MKLCRQYMIESVNEESVNQAMDSTVCK
jgi:hypothetical protein